MSGDTSTVAIRTISAQFDAEITHKNNNSAGHVEIVSSDVTATVQQRRLVVSLGRVLEQRGAVLVLAALHPVTVDLERARLDRLAKEAHRVGVASHRLLVDRWRVQVQVADAAQRYDGVHGSLATTNTHAH